jgi:hypothetical protein
MPYTFRLSDFCKYVVIKVTLPDITPMLSKPANADMGIWNLNELESRNRYYFILLGLLLHPLKHASNNRINNRTTLYVRGRLKNKEGLLIILSHRSLHLC